MRIKYHDKIKIKLNKKLSKNCLKTTKINEICVVCITFLWKTQI